jgi:hypothetical protein
MHSIVCRPGIIPTLLICAIMPPAVVRTQQPEMTMAIFASHAIQSQDWAALENALAAEDSRNAVEMPELAAYRLQLIRGDQIVAGISVQQSITVSVNGDCFSTPSPFLEGHPSIGVLGWVMRKRERAIEPFIHIECDHILQLLQPRIATMSREQQRRVMAIAMSRVILHEWNHIETQSSHHKERGLTKSAFTAEDLMPETDSWATRPTRPKRNDGIPGMR